VRRPHLAALALVASIECGCSVLASTGDWAAYRATRVAPTFEARVAAAQRYLTDRPDGAFRSDVRAYFLHAEEVFYASKKDSYDGLEAYLEALPQGPHHEEAARRIAEIQAPGRNRRAELDRTAADAVKRAAGPAAVARARVRENLDGWLLRFLDAAVFRAPLSAAKADLIIPFSLSLPSPRCAPLDLGSHEGDSHDGGSAPKPPAEGSHDGGSAPKPPAEGSPAVRRCAKLLELPYQVEGPRESEGREATLEIAVVEDAFGTPLEVTLGGPDLFLRLEETYRVKPLATGDAGERGAAVARAVTFVDRAFSGAVDDPESCARPVRPPLALRLACKGVRVDVLPAAAPGEDDRIVVAPVPAGVRR
jgi:hypothetical protein